MLNKVLEHSKNIWNLKGYSRVIKISEFQTFRARVRRAASLCRRLKIT